MKQSTFLKMIEEPFVFGPGRLCHELFVLRDRQSGYVRNLSPAEIVSQVNFVRILPQYGPGLTNIVFMGMGEPFANFEAVKAIDIITDEKVSTWASDA